MQIIHDESQIEVPVRLIDNNDNTYTVELTPPETGSYTTNLHYGGLKVPLVPKVVINPAVDMTKIKVDGLEPSKYIADKDIYSHIHRNQITLDTHFVTTYLTHDLCVKTLSRACK